MSTEAQVTKLATRNSQLTTKKNDRFSSRLFNKIEKRNNR